MKRAEIEQELEAIIREEKTLPPQFGPDTQLSDAGIDSLDALNILFAIEENFGISIPDDRAKSIRTFGDMIRVVEEMLPS